MIAEVEQHPPRLTLYETVLGMSRTELAEKTGLGRKQVSKLLQGRCTQPRVDTIRCISEGLGYTADEVLEFLERLQESPMPYRGGRVLDSETIEGIRADDGTTREVAAKWGTSSETVSKIRRFK